MNLMPLRMRNSGALAAVNPVNISHVTSTVSDGDDYTVKAPSPVYLTVWFAGDHQAVRFVPVDVDGREDWAVTDPEGALRNFIEAAQKQDLVGRLSETRPVLAALPENGGRVTS